VVARRLAENREVSVLLLEAGGSDEVSAVMEAGKWPMSLGNERDWSFAAQPNLHLHGRSIHLAMGKVLGGGSSMNGMAWARGHQRDWEFFGVGPGDGTDRLPATMREILSKSLTLRGFINTEFAEQHYAAFLREVGAGIVDGRIRYREDIVDGLEKAPEAFIGMLDGRNFGKLIVRIVA
jgi:choline dehydrogenase-like flavoprotein